LREIDMTETTSTSGATFVDCTFRGVRFNVSVHAGAAFSNCSSAIARSSTRRSPTASSWQHVRAVHVRPIHRARGDWSFVALAGADLRTASIEGVRMREADLTGARCDGATIRHVDLSGAWLGKASFARCDLRGSDVTAIDPLSTPMDGAIITGTRRLFSRPPWAWTSARIASWTRRRIRDSRRGRPPIWRLAVARFSPEPETMAVAEHDLHAAPHEETPLVDCGRGAIALVAATPVVATAQPPGPGWEKITFGSVTNPAGDVCSFTLRGEPVSQDVWFKTIANLPGRITEVSGVRRTTVLPVHQRRVGASSVEDLSGDAVINTAPDGTQTWYVVGPFSVGFHAGNPYRAPGELVLDGATKLILHPGHVAEVAAHHGPTTDVCAKLSGGQDDVLGLISTCRMLTYSLG